MDMNTNRQYWNHCHKKLHHALATNDHHYSPGVLLEKAIEIFLDQHAMVHSGKMTKSKLWSFEDEVLNEMTEAEIRCIPPKSEHSIAWILFHLARIEDITMNLLVAGTLQLFFQDSWADKLNVNILHSANSMDDRSVAALSAQIDIDELRDYRQSVGRRTREIIRKLKPEEVRQKTDPLRLQKVMDEGALLPEASGILNYWSKRTIAGLLLMPPTRHNFLHLNGALRIKQRLFTANQATR